MLARVAKNFEIVNRVNVRNDAPGNRVSPSSDSRDPRVRQKNPCASRNVDHDVAGAVAPYRGFADPMLVTECGLDVQERTGDFDLLSRRRSQPVDIERQHTNLVEGQGVEGIEKGLDLHIHPFGPTHPHSSPSHPISRFQARLRSHNDQF